MVKQHADYFTCKKNKVTFLLSILVFFIHISTLANYPLNDGLGKGLAFIHFIMVSCAQVAVPMFFIISGVLFYRNYTPKNTLEKYKSRFFSLVIPYLIWNTLWMIFDIICSYTTISNYFIGRTKFELTFVNILKGIFLHTCTPFWFIFNLIIFVLICPLIYYIIKNKIIGALAILALCVLNIFNIGLPESVFFDSASIIYYLVGAYIGMHFFDFFYDKKTKTISIISLITLIFALTFSYINRHILLIEQLNPFIYIIASFAVWFSFDLLENDYYYNYQTESFLIYAMHINISAIITKVIALILPKTSLFACFNYFTTLMLTIVIICTFGIFIGKKLPKVKKILAGR